MTAQRSVRVKNFVVTLELGVDDADKVALALQEIIAVRRVEEMRKRNCRPHEVNSPDLRVLHELSTILFDGTFRWSHRGSDDVEISVTY